MSKRDDMGDVIRREFKRSGLSIKRLAERANVPYAAVHGLMAGTTDSQLTTATKLCRVLGLELRAKSRKG